MRKLLYLLLIVVLVQPVVARGKAEHDLLEKLEKLWIQSEEAARSGKPDLAIARLQRALSLQPYPAKLKELAGEFHFQIAVYQAHQGKLTKALDTLDTAVKTGFTDRDILLKTPEFEEVRNSDRFLAVARSIDDNIVKKRIFDIQTWENPDLDYPGLHPFKDSAELQKLRERYELEKIVASGKSELEKQIMMLDWVHHRWSHSGLQEPSRRDAWTILEEVEEGKRFRCVEYRVVLSEALQSLGWPARTMWLRAKNSSFGVGKGHVVTEVWNNELQQWILLDGQNNAYWSFKNKPLNAQEIRAKDARDVTFVTQKSNWQDPAAQADWDDYFVNLKATVDPGDRPTSLVDSRARYEPLFQGTPAPNKQTSDIRKFYPEMNQVHFDIRPNDTLDELVLDLSHSAPWFSHYQIEIDGAKTELRTHSLEWKLKPGLNRVKVSAVNQQGVIGKPARLDVDFHPSQTQ